MSFPPLPKDIQEIAELIGEESAVLLCIGIGGKVVYLSQSFLPKLVEWVGQEAANKIFEARGGTSIYFPSLSRAMQQVNNQKRNEDIRKDSEGGMSVAQLILKYRLSESHIYKILRESPRIAMGERNRDEGQR